MRNDREWRRERSTHAEVLEGLERVVRAHPAGARRAAGAGGAVAGPAERLAAVIDLRPRLALAHRGGGPGGVREVPGVPDDAA